MGKASVKKQSLNNICESACDPAIVLAFFWALYACLSMLFWYPEPYLYNDALFGGDLGRVSGDMFVIDGEHARVSVHPLFIILIQPVFHVFAGFINDMYLSIFLFHAGAGALLVMVVSLILREVHVRPPLRLIAILVFGLSGSQLIWSAAPETFTYGGLAIALLWLFVLKAAERDRALSVLEMTIMTLFGVLLCGLTLTNVIVFAVGLAYLLRRRKAQKMRIATFFLICVAALIVLVLLSVIQHAVWPLTPVFWSALFGSASGQSADPVMGFLSVDFDVGRVPAWLQQTVLFPWILPFVGLREGAVEAIGNEMIVFGEYGFPAGVLAVVFAVLFFCLIVFRVCAAIQHLAKDGSTGSSRLDAAYLFLLATWVCELVLHYFFDATEAFLFSAHYFFLFVILAAIAIEGVAARLPAVGGYVVFGALLVALVLECIENAVIAQQIASTLHSFTGTSVSVLRSCAVFLLVDFLVIVVSCPLRRFAIKTDVVQSTAILMGVYAFITFSTSAFIVLAF